MRAPLSRARREQRARDRTVDADMLLPGLAGGGDLPADDALAGRGRQFGLDRLALGMAGRAQAGRQVLQDRAVDTMAPQQLGGFARGGRDHGPGSDSMGVPSMRRSRSTT